MKFIKSEVSILSQQPGIVGMLKHIERVGRIAYKSEDRITDDSYIKFNNMIYNRGHWAVFNSGTVYLIIPRGVSELKKLLENIYTKFFYDEKNYRYFITTNYRVIVQLGISMDFLKKYWVDPNDDPRFKKRITTHWICSRGVSHELVRHKLLCVAQ